MIRAWLADLGALVLAGNVLPILFVLAGVWLVVEYVRVWVRGLRAERRKRAAVLAAMADAAAERVGERLPRQRDGED